MSRAVVSFVVVVVVVGSRRQSITPDVKFNRSERQGVVDKKVRKMEKLLLLLFLEMLRHGRQ